jgi:dephospho-CoA kinase
MAPRPAGPDSARDAEPSTMNGKPSPVPFVGLTGGIGAGKSEALAALGRLGAATLSTDAVVHELYASPEVRDAVVERWGPDVAPGGTVDRGAIARHAFKDAGERGFLEGLLWPRVGRRIAEWREQESAKEPAPAALVIEIPLLFESGMDHGFDATIAIVADEEIRRQRAAARGHESVDDRTARQLTQDEKAARATFAVANSGTIADLESRLSGVLAKLKR